MVLVVLAIAAGPMPLQLPTQGQKAHLQVANSRWLTQAPLVLLVPATKEDGCARISQYETIEVAESTVLCVHHLVYHGSCLSACPST